MVIGRIADRTLTDFEIRSYRASRLIPSPGRQRVLVIIPDGTRSMPMPLMFSLFNEFLGKRVKRDYLVALGTHQPMSDRGGQTRRAAGNQWAGWFKPHLQP
jgi:hypothetical protein